MKASTSADVTVISGAIVMVKYGSSVVADPSASLKLPGLIILGKTVAPTPYDISPAIIVAT